MASQIIEKQINILDYSLSSLWRKKLKNLSVILVFTAVIFLVASLGFLGVGVQPPSPNWGLMVKEARAYANLIPWALFFPAAAISLVVIGVNLMADGLKSAFQLES